MKLRRPWSDSRSAWSSGPRLLTTIIMARIRGVAEPACTTKPGGTTTIIGRTWLRTVSGTLQNDRPIAIRTSTSARPARARIKRPERQLVRRASPAGRHQGRVPRARVHFPAMEAGVGSKPRVRVDRVADRALGDVRRVVEFDVVRAKGSGSRLAGMLVLLAAYSGYGSGSSTRAASMRGRSSMGGRERRR